MIRRGGVSSLGCIGYVSAAVEICSQLQSLNLNPDILLMDETLGVGDREFRAKAAKRLEEFILRTGTVIISTHSLGLAKDICSRGIVLDKGQVYFDSNIDESISKYIELTTKET